MQQPPKKVEKQPSERSQSEQNNGNFGVRIHGEGKAFSLAAAAAAVVTVTQTDGGFLCFCLTATLWHEGSRRWLPLRKKTLRGDCGVAPPRLPVLPPPVVLGFSSCRLYAATVSLVRAAANGKRRPVLTWGKLEQQQHEPCVSVRRPCARER